MARLHGDKPENLRFATHPLVRWLRLSTHGVNRVDAIVLDLGVSSMQLDQQQRGFSFAKDGPLDMRMDPSQGITAADVVNDFEAEAIADILWQYGEERKSRQIARAIVEQRAKKAFETTTELADVIRRVVHQKPGTRIDAATRSYQCLSNYVNDELGELGRA